MDRYNFEFYPNDGKEKGSVQLNFEQPNYLTIYELHKMCKKFAIVLGFSPEVVKEVFGEDKFY